MGQISIIGINIMLMMSIFTLLGYIFHKLKKQRDIIFHKARRYQKNKQMELVFIFGLFCLVLFWYLSFLLGLEGLFGNLLSAPVFIILGVFTYSFFKYFKINKGCKDD